MQSSCIECGSCYSICPLIEYNQNFAGPFLFTKSYKLNANLNNANKDIKSVVDSGLFDCMMCGDCAMVCPVGINPKMDITMLQSIAMQQGFSNPNMMNFGSFGGGFTPTF